VPADLRALARSVVCVGFTGDSVSTAPIAELRAFAPGGIILFARNVADGAQLRDLVAALRTCGDVPPLIAIDQEGGRVARITDDSVAALPSPMAVAATADAELCERLGLLLGRDLARLGISVDFAPCADLALDPLNTVIGTRSYGERIAAVCRFVTAFARGLERGGVAAAIKHFPGHGATHTDSHLALPRIDIPIEMWRERDVMPFAFAITEKAASIVMTAHIVLSALDPEFPATLSKRILTGMLRETLGFTGIISTDCLEMDAIANGIGTAQGALAALSAGADLLLISHHLDRAQAAVELIVAAVENGTLPLERLQEAAGRVAALRARYAALAPYDGDVDKFAPAAVAQRAVTAIRGNIRLTDEKPVTVISFEGTIADGAAGTQTERYSLSSALRARRWKSEVMRVALEPGEDDIDLLLSHIPSLGDRNFVVVMRRAHLYPLQAQAIRRILELVPDAIVISAREPYDAALFAQARHLACTYGDERISLEGCADVLSGTARATGTLPVTIGSDVDLH
jgi:beta-N-acetylhexosaminidase